MKYIRKKDLNSHFTMQSHYQWEIQIKITRMVNNMNLENSKQQKLSYMSSGGVNLYGLVRKQINAICKFEEKIFLIQDHISHFSWDNPSVHLVPLCLVKFSIYPAQNCPSWNINYGDSICTQILQLVTQQRNSWQLCTQEYS